MFKKSAWFYDAMYAGKDYAAEAQQIHVWAQQYKRSPGNTLLDVACGTGLHMAQLQAHYTVEGLDLDDQILSVARERLPDVPLHQASMVDFSLGKTYDVITCLFSAIAYTQSLDDLHQTAATMFRHLKPGGVTIIEGFITPDQWRHPHVGMQTVDQPALKIARMNISQRDGRAVTLDFHYMVGTPESIETFTEQHRMSLFSDAEYVAAFEAAGFTVETIPSGLMQDRSVFIGLVPVS